MSIAYVQSGLAGRGFPSSPAIHTQVAFTSPNTAMNTIIVYVSQTNGILANFTITDTQGNTYTQVNGYVQYPTDLRQSAIFVARNAKVSTYQITAVTYDGVNSRNTYTYILVSGVAPTAGDKVFITGMTNSANNYPAPTGTTVASTGLGTFTTTVGSPGINESGSSGTGVDGMNTVDVAFDQTCGGAVVAAEYTGNPAFNPVISFSNQINTSTVPTVTLTTTLPNQIVDLFYYQRETATAVPPVGFVFRNSTSGSATIGDGSAYWDKVIPTALTTTYSVTGAVHPSSSECILWGVVLDAPPILHGKAYAFEM